MSKAVSTAADPTRSRLLRAAAEVLSRRGYSQARLQEIAEAADLKPPAIYYHFTSRDDLITAALREGQVLVRQHVVAALAALPSEASALLRILTAVEAHLRLELELSEFASAVVRTASHVPAHIRADIKTEVDAYYDIWRELIGRAGSDGVLRAGLDQSIARMLILGAMNWAIEWRTPSTAVDDVVAQALSLIRHALTDVRSF